MSFYFSLALVFHIKVTVEVLHFVSLITLCACRVGSLPAHWFLRMLPLPWGDVGTCICVSLRLIQSAFELKDSSGLWAVEEWTLDYSSSKRPRNLDNSLFNRTYIIAYFKISRLLFCFWGMFITQNFLDQAGFICMVKDRFGHFEILWFKVVRVIHFQYFCLMCQYLWILMISEMSLSFFCLFPVVLR